MFLLMNKNNIVVEFDFQDYGFGDCLSYWNQQRILPYGCDKNHLFSWLHSRKPTGNKHLLLKFINEVTDGKLGAFINLTHCVSLSDCFWIKDAQDNIAWENVSPYRNVPDAVIQQYAFGLSGYKLPEFTASPDFSTDGSYPKCWQRDTDGLHLYKRGGESFGTTGREPYCEVLASRVYKQMRAGISYALKELHGFTASVCKPFTNEHLSFVQYSTLQQSDLLGDINKYYKKYENYETFARIIVCDAIVCNIDRHTRNYGIYVNPDTMHQISVAPGFDYNLALLAGCEYNSLDEAISKANTLQLYTGESFIQTAKRLLTDTIRDDLLNLRGIELSLPAYDEVMSEARTGWLTDLVNRQIDKILQYEVVL